MDISSESWDIASQDQITYTKAEMKARKTGEESKMLMLHQLLLIIDCLQKPREYLISTGLNDYEKIDQINLSKTEKKGVFYGFYNGNGHNVNFNEEITKFLSFNYSGIPTRIYFVLDDQIAIFLEHKINNTFIKEKKKFKGNCFSVDINGFIQNQSIVFSKSCSHHKFFTNLLCSISKNLDIKKDTVFDLLDNQRIQSIPTNINKMKLHPLYITEECCNNFSIIYPKRPVFGYYKGAPVYSKQNLIKLKTEKSWYMNGRVIKGRDDIINNYYLKEETTTIPYRIYNNKKLFAEFQTEPIVVNDISGKVMDAFHNNFTPGNCVYLSCDATVAKELNIPYAECNVGFKYKEIYRKGIFVRKEDCFIVNYFTKENEYYNKVEESVKDYEELYRNWKKFLIKVKEYGRITKRIGLD